MMIIQRIFLAIFLLGNLTVAMNGQEILMTIGDREITLDEFERIYNKNNSTITENQQAPEEYLDLFVNFKLKVLEAESLGMDTTKKFLDEFNGYKEQLAKPYLTDEDTKNKLMKEAYERMKWDVHASHILLTVPYQPSPEDTLARYNKALEIRQRLLNGEDFETVARATSEDRSVKNNGGDLGFFTAFTMVYEFEKAAYDLKVGEISMPVKSEHGYHIIKKLEVRPAVGKVKIAHIYLATPEGTSDEARLAAKNKMMMLYDSLKMGSDFAELARRNSDDKGSAQKGGELPWFGTGRMIPEFESRAFKMENPGDITEPFNSDFGWHLIKLLDKEKVGTYEEMESELLSKAIKGHRENVVKDQYIKALKAKYEYALNESIYNTLYSFLDSSIFQGKWDPSQHPVNYDEVLFSTSLGKIKVGDFADYLSLKQKKRAPIPLENYVDINFNFFLENYLTDAEMKSLPDRFPEYKYILQEYHDGILLFELMDKNVWTKAVEDTLGLEKFFADHRTDYMWNDRIEAIIVTCDTTVDVNLVHNKSAKIASGKWDLATLKKKFCNDTVDCITLETVRVEKGRNAHIDALNETPGAGKVFSENGKSKFVIGKVKLPPMEKELDETRGQVTADYQDYLEDKWIEELRQKYNVDVNMDMLSKIE